MTLRTAALVAACCAVMGGCGGGDDKPAPSAAVPAELKDGLQVGMDISFPPFEYMESGSPTGIDVDLSNALAEQLGTTAKLQNIAFDGLVTALKGERVDIVISGLNDTRERQQTVDFVDYFAATKGLLVADGNPENVHGTEDLCGLTMAQLSGSQGADQANEAGKDCERAGEPAIEILTFESSSDCYEAIKAGRADAQLDDYAPQRYTADTSDGGNDFDAVQAPGFASYYFGIAVPKADTAVFATIKQAFGSLLESGRYRSILARYGLESGLPKSVVVNEAAS
jgi:polar amino acid transport system substrate-binding protein